MDLFHIEIRVTISHQIITSSPLSLMAAVCRKLLVGDNLEFNESSLSLTPHMDGVLSKFNTNATLPFPEAIGKSEFIDPPISNFSTFQADKITSLHLWTSGSRVSQILDENIYQANGITVTITLQHIPETLVVHTARCAEKWGLQGNQFDNKSIEGD